MQIPYGRIARSYGTVEDFEAGRRWLRKGLLEGLGDFTMLELRSAALRILYATAWNSWTLVETLDEKRGAISGKP